MEVAGVSMAIEGRFWPKVDKNGPVPIDRSELGPCWIWTAATNGVGYGVLGRGGRGAGLVYAHRFSYQIHRGAIPDGLELDHLCRNRGCVNPYHLEPVTRSENLRRSPVVGRYPRPTHCPQGHEMIGDNVRISPAGGRVCRACCRERRRIYFAAHREEELRKNREYHRQGRRRPRGSRKEAA
jgi:hypothetical protein